MLGHQAVTAMSDVDDPFKPSDATIIRPRPGAGRRGVGETALPRRPAPQPYAEPASPLPHDLQGPGLNPLVGAASSLLLLSGQLRSMVSVPDVGALRRQIVDEVRHFEERAAASGARKEIVLAARYALCAAIDEAVLSTPWGAQSEWPQQTLLVTFHREAWGGEKFFEMLERVSGDPERQIDLMELHYLCIALGFAGKYHASERGHAQLAEVEQTLYRRIRDRRGVPPSELSDHWQGVEDRRNRLIRYVPWWVFAAAALLVISVAFIGYYVSLGNAAAPVKQALVGIGIDDLLPSRPAPAVGPTLKQLLSPYEQRGLLTVDENGGRTVITLTDLFASGSAAMNDAYADTVKGIAAALNQVPGRVTVVGHTDDQPLRSFRYRDNYELSRERAASVVGLLKQAIDNPGRLTVAGAGSDRPRFVPATDPTNRAKNRRVEIVHSRG